jgi:hypothetical protein
MHLNSAGISSQLDLVLLLCQAPPSLVQLCSNLEGLGCHKSVWFLSACRAVSPERIFCRHPGQHWCEFASVVQCSQSIIHKFLMQVLSPEFLRHYKKDIINIHHGLLPSFKGANPYRQVQPRTTNFTRFTANQCKTVWYCPITTQHCFETMSIISFIAFLSFQIWRADWCEIWYMVMLDCYRHMKLG